MRPAQSGFTLLEMMVVIAIAAVLTTLAVPSFRATIASAQAREAATAFYSALAQARSEAIARNLDTSICARDISNLQVIACKTTASTWQDGWIVYQGSTPTNPIQIHEALPDRFTLSTVISPLVFKPDGRVASAVVFDLCRSDASTVGRRVSVSRSGRVALEKRPC